MRKFWAYFKIFYQARFEYRGDMLIYSLSSASTPLLGLALWLTTANSNNLPFNNSELIAYFIAAIFVGIATEMWQSWFVSEDITTGNFSALLLKPFPVILKYVLDNLSDKVYKISMIVIPMILIYFVIPKNVWNQYHLNPYSLVLFLLALIFGYVIIFLIEFSVGLSTVWFYDIGFLKSFFDLAGTFFAGKLIPLIFFPGILLNIAIFLPFRYTVSFPIEILLGKLQPNQLLLGFSVEIFWVILIFLTYKLIYLMFKKNYQGFGS